MALPIYTHIPNLKSLTKIFLKLSHPKGNLCGGGGDGSVTVLNPKYRRLSSGDTKRDYFKFADSTKEFVYAFLSVKFLVNNYQY